MKNQISNLNQIGYIRSYTLTEGKENGVKVIELYNGYLHVYLNESKALDIMQIIDRGVNASFISKNGFSTRSDDFVKRFEGGMLYTVGLDSAGLREGFPLHGSFHNLNPIITKKYIDEKEIIIEAKIEDTVLFGKNLTMIRKYRLPIGGNYLELIDTLINLGKEESEYCLLYHNNLGYPYLDDGDVIKSKTNEIISRTPFAQEKIKECFQISKPINVTEETCYFLKNKVGQISLVNPKLERTFELSYSLDTLPEFVLWKSMKSQDYALGLEPSTTKLDDYFKYQKIKPGEEIKFALKYSFK